MAATADLKNEMTATSTQTDVVSSDILWQCIYVIKKEFGNLDYRVTKGQKGQEMVVVFRSDAFGVFGPPLDPITLTLDSSGQSLLAILFKPVQRISFVSAESGCVEVNSLLTLLKLVSGKGFYFCPGIPEQFLAGKAYSKNVILHKLPFKRFQASNCPVYYQSPPSQLKKSSKSSFLSICQRCLQAAATVQQLPSHNYLHQHSLSMKSDIPKDIRSVYAGELTLDKKGVDPPGSVAHLPGSQVFASLPLDVGKEIQKAVFGLPKSKNSAILDINAKTNGLSGGASVEMSKCDTLVDKLKSGTSSLRSMLQEKYKKKTLLFPDDSIQSIKIESSKNKCEEKAKCNVCKQCKKQFSTPAALLNHLQRHEGLTGSWKNRLRSKKQDPVFTSTSSLLRMLARSSKSQGGTKGKNNSPAMSKSALKLVIKYLDALIPSMNGANAVKKENIKLDSDIPVEKSSTNSVAPSDDLSRPSSGFDAVQSLLDAAAFTGSGLDDLEKSTSLAPGRKRRAVAAVLPVPQPSLDDTWVKKARKSTRLASKKSKGKQSEPVSEGSSSQDTTLLRNLDLLSSVSLNLHVPSSNPVTSHVNSYASAQPLGSASVFSSINDPNVPCPNTFSVSNNLLSNTCGGNKVFNKSPQASSYDSSGVKLPPVPPLLFAGAGHEEPVPYASANIQGQYSFDQTTMPVTCSPSILRNLVSVSAVSSSDCGAMDLSKPKHAGLSPNIPHDIQIGIHPRQPDSHLEKEDPKEMLKCIMLMSKTAPASAVQPAESVISDKRSDSNLQARMFASARNYKIDKKSHCVPQVQAVIASTSCIVQGGVKGGRGHGPPTQGDEIQCGYKWSGSGGLVKERTQLVRELVPLEVMTSLLSRATSQLPGSSAINLASPPQSHHQQLAMASVNSPHHQLSMPTANSLQHQQLAMPNGSSSVQSLAAPSVALNLTTAKQPNHIPSPKRAGPGRPRKSAANNYATSSPPDWSPPVPNTKSILRSSLMHSADRAAANASSLPSHLSNYSLSLNSPLITTCSNSSPSLSAMLRQPASTNHADCMSGSGYGTIESAALHGNSPLGIPKGLEIKSEPMDNYLQPSQDRIIMALPIKAERSDYHRGNQLIVDEEDSGSQNLVMDIR